MIVTGKLSKSITENTIIIKAHIFNPVMECSEPRRYPRITRSKKDIKLSNKLQKIFKKELHKILKRECLA